MELDENQYLELTSGGECNSHFHSSFGHHDDITRFYDRHKVVQVGGTVYKAKPDDDIIIVDTSISPIIVQLPVPVGQRVFIVTRKGGGANTMHVEFAGDNVTCLGLTQVDFTAAGEVKRFMSWNNNWILI